MKKFFLGLIAFGLSIISFSYGDGVVSRQSVNLYNGNSPHIFQCDGFCCIFNSDSASSSRSNSYFVYSGQQIYFSSFGQNDYYCMQYSGIVSTTMNTSSTAHVIFYNVGSVFSDSSCPICPTCPECETCPTCSDPNVHINKIVCDGGDCSYSDNQLMRVQTGDTIFINLGTGLNFDGYHVGGNGNVNYYFSSEEVICPIYTGNEVSTGENWSALFINGIQHESSPLINVNIADWVVWDYSISEDSFDLDIGSGYDQDYIDGVIDVQSYRPTSEDFTQTFVGGLILFTPYVVILLFVILIWKLIKGIFKTK